MTNPRISDRVCFVCARPAVGYGYAPPRIKSASEIAFCCDDPECLQIAKSTYMMKQLEFGRIEQLATGDAGDKAGAYLDEIGKTDLATLTATEWHTFLEQVIAGYRAALKGRLRDEAPF
jgi:hypothetical protein